MHEELRNRIYIGHNIHHNIRNTPPIDLTGGSQFTERSIHKRRILWSLFLHSISLIEMYRVAQNYRSSPVHYCQASVCSSGADCWAHLDDFSIFPQWFLLTTNLGTCWTDSFWRAAVAKMKVCKASILGHPPDHPFIQLGRFRDSTLTLISDWSVPTTIAKFTTITWLGLPCTNLVTQCPSHCHKNALWQLCLLTELYFMKSSISDLFISPNT